MHLPQRTALRSLVALAVAAVAVAAAGTLWLGRAHVALLAPAAVLVAALAAWPFLHGWRPFGVPGLRTCPACGTAWHPRDEGDLCPACMAAPPGRHA